MNQREYREILFNGALAPLQKLLYAYLRSCMDWESCIVGDANKKLISYQSIREHLEYLPPRGSQARPVQLSRDQVKRLLAGLVEAGIINRLKGQRYGVELRFFLPFASSGKVRPEEERHMSAIVGPPQCTSSGLKLAAQSQQELEPKVTPQKDGMIAIRAPYHERHTSLVLLSLSNQYIQYDPDDDDLRWLKHVLGADVAEHRSVDVGLETEKFNLRYSKDPDYDQAFQREDWRVWMIRAVEYSRGGR